MGLRLYRFENSFTLGPVTATEGFWYYVDDRVDPVGVADLIREVVEGWFTEPNPDSSVSRADLMPVEARFTRSKLISFALDLLEVESELYDAFVSIPAQRDVEPLPSIVSKEIEIKGPTGGRGKFNRIHTSFHPQDAVEPTDSRLCTLTYQSQLVDVYTFLFDLVALSNWRVGAFGHFETVYAVPAYVQTPRDSSNHILEYRVFDAVSVGSQSRRWGSMRRRGAIVHH